MASRRGERGFSRSRRNRCHGCPGHGVLLKLELEKIKKSEVKPAVLKIHEVWKRSGKKLTMKECAIKVAEEYEIKVADE